MSSQTPPSNMIGRLVRRRKKTNQSSMRRFRCKRKRSLLSLLSKSSISSNFMDRSSNFNENHDTQQSNLPKNDDVISISSSLIVDPFDDEDHGVLSGNDNDILLNTSLSSISSASSSDSDDSSTDYEFNTENMNSNLSDHGPIHSSTSATVYEFSRDILEFCRTSHLASKQRIHLLELFRKYLPSPNLVPKSGDDLLSKFLLSSLFL